LVPTFPVVGAEFKVGLASRGYLISLYIVGYGAEGPAHVRSVQGLPAGGAEH
jgi:hypothetical protein